MGMVYGALNAIFNPILSIDPNPTNPALTVLIIAFIVSLITTIANKYLVDQDEMNEIQERNKAFQKELREAQKKGDGKRMAELQAKQTESEWLPANRSATPLPHEPEPPWQRRIPAALYI